MLVISRDCSLPPYKTRANLEIIIIEEKLSNSNLVRAGNRTRDVPLKSERAGRSSNYIHLTIFRMLKPAHVMLISIRWCRVVSYVVGYKRASPQASSVRLLIISRPFLPAPDQRFRRILNSNLELRSEISLFFLFYIFFYENWLYEKHF